MVVINKNNFENFFSNRMFDFFTTLQFNELTEAQEMLIPVVRSGKSAMLISPTGSGKTEAAIFPIFDYILNNETKPITSLFITPLPSQSGHHRELCPLKPSVSSDPIYRSSVSVYLSALGN